jgi:benzoyl-CoA reductase/2-hydroxyglutaryl-CoA dehydratase subunit BcrC/BadD/HgdB
VAVVRSELERIRAALAGLAGLPLGDEQLAAGIREANRVRALLADLRHLAYTAEPYPMPALEMLIAEMLAIHFCSDRAESVAVLQELLDEVRRRVDRRAGVLAKGSGSTPWRTCA